MLLQLQSNCCISLQAWNPIDGEDEVLVMVCRTGLNTAMGQTVRELLAPSKAPRNADPLVVVRQLVTVHAWVAVYDCTCVLPL